MLTPLTSSNVTNKIKSCLIQGRFDEALESIVQAEISKTITENEFETFLLYKIEGYIGILRYKEAIEISQSISNRKLNLRNYSTIIQANLFEIECLRCLQSFDEAKILVDKTEKVFSKLSTVINTSVSELYAKYNFFKGHLLQSMGKISESIETYQEALLVVHNINDRFFQQKILVNLASAYWEKNDLEVAHKLCMQALAIKTTEESYLTISKCLNLMGLIAQDKHNISSALNYYNQSLALKYKIGNRIEVAKTLHSIGFVNSLLEKHQESLNALEECYLIFEELENYSEMSILQNDIGYVYLKQGNTLQTLKNFKTALSLSTKVKNNYLTAKNYYSLSKIYLLKLDLDNALLNAKNALEIRKNINNPAELGETYLQIAIIYFIQKKSESGLELLDKSIVTFEESKNKLSLVRSQVVKLILLEGQNASEKTFNIVSKVIEITETSYNEKLMILGNLAGSMVLKNSVRLQDKGKAINMFKEISQNLKLDAFFTEYALIQEILLLFYEFELYENEKTLEEIRNCIAELSTIVDKNNQFLLQIHNFRIKTKLSLLLENIDNAMAHLEEAFLFAQSKGLTDVIEKLQIEYESLDKKISYWNAFKKKKKISYSNIDEINLLELIKEIQEKNLIFYV